MRVSPNKRSAWARTVQLTVACAFALCATQSSHVRADELNVAVAANFLATLQRLAPLFEKASGHKLLVSPGSSGQLYAQIQRGAPYDVLLSADRERPARLEAEGLAMKGSRFTFAIGRLVLWCGKPSLAERGREVLTRPELRFVALADPKTAPYGVAAEQVLAALQLLDPLKDANKLVYGQSVGQTHQFATSGHADCAFVALSQATGEDGKVTGSLWLIPETLYTQLDQDAVILGASPKQQLAGQFLDWLRSDPTATGRIRAAGYALPTK